MKAGGSQRLFLAPNALYFSCPSKTVSREAGATALIRVNSIRWKCDILMDRPLQGIFAIGGMLELAAAHGQAGQFVFHNKFSIGCFVDSESG